jgi:hypothetical protein
MRRLIGVVSETGAASGPILSCWSNQPATTTNEPAFFLGKAMSAADGTCRTCKHFNSGDDGGATLCQRNPPTPFLVAMSPQGPQFSSAWPPTRESLWCGEHQIDNATIN